MEEINIVKTIIRVSKDEDGKEKGASLVMFDEKGNEYTLAYRGVVLGEFGNLDIICTTKS
mgnify:CR=1 FL=1